MDALSTFLEAQSKHVKTKGHFLGLLNVVIGRSITAKDGTVVAGGLTWRETAGLFKRLRWDPELVRELGVEPDDLPPRDRQRFWYTAIARAGVDGPEAAKAGDRFAEVLRKQGFTVSAGPSA
jgi:hypothetical protein